MEDLSKKRCIMIRGGGELDVALTPVFQVAFPTDHLRTEPLSEAVWKGNRVGNMAKKRLGIAKWC
jgi:hypothetical protein